MFYATFRQTFLLQPKEGPRMKMAFTTLATSIVLLLTVMAPLTHAATNTVTSTADNGAGTLRNALASVANGDTINFTVTGSITLTTGELLVSNNVTISGPGPGSLAVSGNAASRVFHITNAVTAVISGLTITNGVVSGSFPGFVGAGIWNQHSTLTLSNCIIIGNQVAGGFAGGLFNDGSSGSATLSIIASTFNGNVANSGGGGIFNYSPGGTANISINASTFSGNNGNAGGGGGIFNSPGGGYATITASNSTFSGNACSSDGGGIVNSVNTGTGVVTVVACTFSANAAGPTGLGGGIYNNGGTGTGLAVLTVIASTFSGNTAATSGGGSIYNSGPNAKLEIGNTILKAGLTGGNIGTSAGTSDGYNLSSDNGGGVLTNSTDKINTDPMLGPLANNGGPTLTIAPLPGSPAIDRGKSFGLTTDQRGFPRPIDDPCITNAVGGDGSDIGALETQTACVNLQITAITRETNNIRVTWTTYAGKTNALQRTTGAPNGSYQTNTFTDIFTATNTTGSPTNYLDVSAATNSPARYYRVRLVP
jgi:hypothetical protein